MALTWNSYGSSSKGSCYILDSPNAKIMIDAGLNIYNNSTTLNLVRQVSFLFISHEHIDHTRFLKTFLQKNKKAKVIIHPLCFVWLTTPQFKDYEYIRKNEHRFIKLSPQEDFKEVYPIFNMNAGKIQVKAFKVSHNSFANNGYLIKFFADSKNEIKVTFFTDCGSLEVNSKLLDEMNESDIWVFEANHQSPEEDYKIETTKERVQFSDKGHFSSKQLDKLLAALKQSNYNTAISQELFLIHTSPTNFKNFEAYDAYLRKKYNIKLTRMPMIETKKINLNHLLKIK
ncbi:MBL fold metallo-hydrolase [Mycoplasma sp. 392]